MVQTKEECLQFLNGARDTLDASGAAETNLMYPVPWRCWRNRKSSSIRQRSGWKRVWRTRKG